MAMNPYITGKPLSDEQSFYGREDWLSWVDEAHNSNLEIHGASGMGKTCLLQRLRRLIKERHPNAICIYINGETLPSTNPEGLPRALLQELQYATSLDQYPQPEPGSSAFEKYWHYQRVLYANGRRIYIFLDEFVRILRTYQLDRYSLRWLRSLTQEPDHQATLAISTLIPLPEIDNQNLVDSNLARIFDDSRRGLLPWDRETAIRAVHEPANRAGLVLPEGTAEKLFQLCGGHPSLTYLCANRFVKALQQGQTIQPDHEEFNDFCMGFCQDHLARELDPLLSNPDYRREYQQISEAGCIFGVKSEITMTGAIRELYRTGLFLHHPDRQQVRPCGALVLQYTNRSFRRPILEEYASDQDMDDFRKRACLLEQRLREYIRNAMDLKVGANWTSDPKYFPKDYTRHHTTTHPIDGVTFNQLVVLGGNIPKEPPQFSSLLTSLRTALTIRNDYTIHIKNLPPLTLVALQDANHKLRELQDYLDRHA